MYISDRKATHGLAIFALLVGPWYGVSKGSGGWLLEVALLIAALWIGRSMGFRMMTVGLALGYGAALLAGGGFSSLIQIGFLPWVSLLTIWGIEQGWPRKANFFWSLALVGILGFLPVIPTLQQGTDLVLIQEITRSMIDQYRESGMLTTLAQQGINETEIEKYVQQFIQYVFLFMPGLAALGAMFKFGAVYYFYARWFPQKGQPFPLFSSFRLPWYAIWGINFGISCYLIGDQWSFEGLRVLGMNFMFIYAFLAFVLGSSIFLYYLRSPRLSGFLKGILIISGIVYFQVMVISLILLGFFDLAFNLRRIPEDSQ